MKTLLLLRHAKSSWKNPALPDHERPLNKRGKRAAPRMGRLLQELQLVPDQIVSSTAVRARETAAAVADNCGFEGAIELNEALYMAAPETVAQVVCDIYQDDPCLMIVGHNPGFEELLESLTRCDEHFPTAALAHITLPLQTWRNFTAATRGTLVKLWRPRELD